MVRQTQLCCKLPGSGGGGEMGGEREKKRKNTRLNYCSEEKPKDFDPNLFSFLGMSFLSF